MQSELTMKKDASNRVENLHSVTFIYNLFLSESSTNILGT